MFVETIDSQTFGKCRDFWKVERLLESRRTFGKWRDFWKVGGLLESRGTFGKWGDFWEVEDLNTEFENKR